MMFMVDLTPECSCRPMERWNYCASRCPVTFAREQKKMRSRQSIASPPSPPLSQLGFDDGNEISGRILESEISACTFYDINRRVDVENGHFREWTLSNRYCECLFRLLRGFLFRTFGDGQWVSGFVHESSSKEKR